uniref:Uncharacterized protein n=1 Tax=Peronospora matthiolae TaxID=2874970 RepID=A0AAV1TAW5_9STRA
MDNWHLSPHTQKAIGQPPGVVNALVVIVARRVEPKPYRSTAIVGFDMICDSAAGSRAKAIARSYHEQDRLDRVDDTGKSCLGRRRSIAI